MAKEWIKEILFQLGIKDKIEILPEGRSCMSIPCSAKYDLCCGSLKKERGEKIDALYSLLKGEKIEYEQYIDRIFEQTIYRDVEDIEDKEYQEYFENEEEEFSLFDGEIFSKTFQSKIDSSTGKYKNNTYYRLSETLHGSHKHSVDEVNHFICVVCRIYAHSELEDGFIVGKIIEKLNEVEESRRTSSFYQETIRYKYKKIQKVLKACRKMKYLDNKESSRQKALKTLETWGKKGVSLLDDTTHDYKKRIGSNKEIDFEKRTVNFGINKTKKVKAKEQSANKFSKLLFSEIVKYDIIPSG